jgi:hypothetical protein
MVQVGMEIPSPKSLTCGARTSLYRVHPHSELTLTWTIQGLDSLALTFNTVYILGDLGRLPSFPTERSLARSISNLQSLISNIELNL